MRKGALLVALLGALQVARADPGPPPDPRAGERSDGKIRDRQGTADALAVPRILLAPPRLALRLLSLPIKGVMALEGRYHVFGWFYRMSTSEDGLRGVRPAIRYASRFEPQFGLTYFDNKTLGRGSHLELTLGVVLPKLLFAEIHVRPRLPRPFRLEIDLDYLHRDDLLFAGVGLASDGDFRPRPTPQARFSMHSIDLSAVLDVRLHRMVRAQLAQRWAYRRYGHGSGTSDEPPIPQVYCLPQLTGCTFPIVDPLQVPGFYDGANFLAADGALSVDTREGERDPHAWFRLELGARYAHGLSIDGPQWVRARGQASAGFALGAHTRMLVLRLSVELLEPLGGSTVPFTELVTLGGPDDLRGAAIGRYRDYSSVLITAEYRWAIWMWMDAVLFADMGGVFATHLTDFKPDRLVPDVGVGIRLHTERNFVLRAHVAYGLGEGFQVSLSTSTGL